MADSTETLKSPQTDRAIKTTDPTIIDDTAIFTYNTSNNLQLNAYFTAIQDTINVVNPQSFPNDTQKKYAPTTSPFILQLTGTGFASLQQLNNSLFIYANIGDFIAIIPPLPSSANLHTGRAFGYVIKSDTSIWIYFNRLLFQEIWFKPLSTIDKYDGKESIQKIQIECATSAYPFLSNLPALKIYIAPNNGILKFEQNFFAQTIFKNATITLNQSPYIITIEGAKNNKSIEPIIKKTNDTITRLINLFGHNLQNNKILMVKQASQLLLQNPSTLPLSVLNSDQTEQTIKSTDATTIQNLEYFKVGNFLDDLKSNKPTKITKADYFAADGTKKNSDNKGLLPVDKLPTITFNIKTLPASAYYVAVYDSKTGAYSVAPDVVVVNNIDNLQIHDIVPIITTLSSPTFTINGFNFPIVDDINNGATLTATLSYFDNITSGIFPISTNATLTIDKTSNSKDINGNGTLETTDTKITAKFSDLHMLSDNIASTTIFLILQVIYPKTLTIPKNDNVQVSPPVSIQAPPIILFLSNSEAVDNSTKRPISIDHDTGQVILDAIPTNDLFVVGTNFGDGSNVSVIVGGNDQKVNELRPWKLNTIFSALKITIDPKNLNGDVSIEVRVGNISSEPYVVSPDLSSFIFDSVVQAGGKQVSKGEQRITITSFENILPTIQNGSNLLTNNKNTKVSSSLPVKLVNDAIKQNVSVDNKNPVAISFLPNTIIVPDNTPLTSNKILDITFSFYSIMSVNISTPKIIALLHLGRPLTSAFNPGDIMTVLGDGFANGMRFNINNTGWRPVDKLFALESNGLLHQAFNIEVPDSAGHTNASIQVSNQDAQKVSNVNTSGKQNGSYKVQTIVVNDKYSPLLKINMRLPAGIKVYAKGPQVAMTDVIDANMSIYSQITPFLGSFKTLLVIIRVIVCIIDVICALINPFQLIIAIIALMDCIIDLLSLFPQLAVPIMILSFLQNFIGFLTTFITQIEAYVFSIINSQLAMIRSQELQDFGALAAAEQQSFGITKQIRDVIAFLEPALQIIQIFKDLLSFAMHFPCASNQGSKQNDNTCPPDNMKKLINGDVGGNNVVSMTDEQKATLSTMFCQATAIQTNTLQAMPGFSGRDPFGQPTSPLSPGSTANVPLITPVLPNISGAIECMTLLTDNIENALNNGQTFITSAAQGEDLLQAYRQCIQNLLDQTRQAIGDTCTLAVSALNSELKVGPKGSIDKNLGEGFIKTKIGLPSIHPNDIQDAGLVLDLATLLSPDNVPPNIITDITTGSASGTHNFGLKPDINTPIIIQTTNKSGQRQSKDTIYFNADNPDVGDLIVIGDILEIIGGVFNGLQFPILGIQKIFTSVRLTTKLDITPEQKLLVGEQPIPPDLSGFDVKIIAHLAGNDDVAVVPADNASLATITIMARDHHGHLIGPGVADRISLNIDSGDAIFVPITPSSTTDITGVIREQSDYYIATIKADCAGIVIISASVCNIELVDIGYYTTDPNHVISTRKKTIKIIFTPPIPIPHPNAFESLEHVQQPGSHFNN